MNSIKIIDFDIDSIKNENWEKELTQQAETQRTIFSKYILNESARGLIYLSNEYNKFYSPILWEQYFEADVITDTHHNRISQSDEDDLNFDQDR